MPTTYMCLHQVLREVATKFSTPGLGYKPFSPDKKTPSSFLSLQEHGYLSLYNYLGQIKGQYLPLHQPDFNTDIGCTIVNQINADCVILMPET